MEQVKDSEKVEFIVRYEDNNTEESISLNEILQKIFKGKWLILGITFIFVVAYILYTAFYGYKNEVAQAIVELNFSGIENGLKPDGTKFEMHAFKTPVIIQKAIDEAGIEDKNISVEEIRKDILIEPVIPEAINKAALAAAKDGKNFVYYPNQFIISYDPDNILFVKKKKVQILTSIIAAYEADFRDKYTDKSVLGNALESLNYDSYDYPEISTIIHNQISIIKNYLNSKADEAPEFRSKNTGLTFNDIIGSLDIIENIDVNRLDSIVGSFNLTKDKAKLITKYEYIIKMNELNQAKKNDESITALNMMEKFNLDQKSILIPGLTGSESETSGESLTIADNSYYDTLAERAADAGVEAANFLHDNEYLRKEIEKLNNDTVPDALKKSAVKDALALADSIKENIIGLIQQTNNTAIEYFDMKYTQAIKRLSPVEILGMNKLLYLMISVVSGFVLGIIIALFREYWKGNKGTPSKSFIR
jgi:hypothetical protein